MGDAIYLIDLATREPICVHPASFAEINVKERADLEQWVLRHPEILGEPLLVITCEFDGFDKSSRRLDILALDKEGVVVVVELKLDVAGSMADWQAIGYAAFCSNLTIADVVTRLARSDGGSDEEAAKKIREFLDREELPELTPQPRIILAAGSMHDQELTSRVLWLRRFGVDISCVELTPYRIPDSQRIVLVPRIVIPLAETRDYQIGVERKETTRIQEAKRDTAIASLWETVVEQFNKLRPRFQAASGGRAMYKPIRIGKPHIHYEWVYRKSLGRLDVCLHFEAPDRQRNVTWMEPLRRNESDIRKDVDLEYQAEPWGREWAQAMFRIPFDGDVHSAHVATKAAETMKLLMDRTWPLIENADI